MRNKQKPVQKVASRFLLPVEILLGLLTFSSGIVAAHKDGLLFRLLSLHGEQFSWVIMYCAIGGVAFIISSFEWLIMRSADVRLIFHIVSARATMNFLSAGIWIGGMFVLFEHGLAGKVLIHVFLAIISCPFYVWCYYENIKVRYAINPKLHTPTLEFHR